MQKDITLRDIIPNTLKSLNSQLRYHYNVSVHIGVPVNYICTYLVGLLHVGNTVFTAL